MEQLIQSIKIVQGDLVILGGMMEVAKEAAYSGKPSALIGNAIEGMLEYLGKRDEMLDELSTLMECKEKSNIRCDAPLDISSAWDEFIAQQENREKQSDEMTAAYDSVVPYLELLPPDKENELYRAIKEVGKASRKQGFMEGMMAAGVGEN